MKSGDKIQAKNFFVDQNYFMEEIEFADGSKWSLDELKDKARYYYGTDGNNTITASDSRENASAYEDDYMYGRAGNDTLSGNSGNDELYGEAGADRLNGGAGDDLLIGGIGNDILAGGNGNDTYIFNIGDGNDTINELNGSDKVIFGADINSEDLMFEKKDNNLVISLIGQEDTITITNYYSNDSYKVESFETADGNMLDYTKLDLMIQAMASFEDSTGMMWEEAIAQSNEQANDIVNQWWTKEEI